MKLPREVKILHHTYKVLEVDEIKADLHDGDEPGEEILGLLDDTNLQILIAKNMNASRKAQVFLHELTHAVFNVIDGRRLLRDPESEESIINAFSDILLQVLSDNQFQFQKVYVQDNCTDPQIVQNVMTNHQNGVDVKSICNSFHLEEKEVKKIIKQNTAPVPAKKKKGAKKKT